MLDARGHAMQNPKITLLGVEDDSHKNALHEEMEAVVLDALEDMSGSARLEDASVQKTVIQALRRFLQESQGKKPMVEVHVMRI